MQSTPKKVKGFTILEVVIVLAIVGVVSAIGIPKFNSWNKDRIVKGEAERVRDIVVSINSQVQRGLYGFGQFEVSVSEGIVSFSTNGMLMGNIATKVLDRDNLCRTGDKGLDYWDHFGINKQNAEVRLHQTEEIKVDVSNGAVCFSKDGSLFSGDLEFENNDNVVESIFICSRNIGTCEDPDVDNTDSGDTQAVEGEGDESQQKKVDDDDEDGGIIYVVSWSRFGNVKLEKWYSGKWIIQ